METTINQRPAKMSAEFATEKPNEAIEEQTKKIPNLFFLSMALISMAGSLTLALNRKKDLANFVGQWVPTLLILGLYNKVVKVEDELLKLH